jgi:cell division protein FtsB
MRARVVLVVSAGVVAVIGATAAFSPSGLARLERLRVEETAVATDVERLTNDNARLAAEVERLRGTDPASRNTLEGRAREELGYIGKDEVVLVLPSAGAQ